MQPFDLYKYNEGKLILTAAAHGQAMAWALIRNECYKRKIPVPTMDKVVLVRKLTAQETKDLMEGKNLF